MTSMPAAAPPLRRHCGPSGRCPSSRSVRNAACRSIVETEFLINCGQLGEAGEPNVSAGPVLQDIPAGLRVRWNQRWHQLAQVACRKTAEEQGKRDRGHTLPRTPEIGALQETGLTAVDLTAATPGCALRASSDGCWLNRTSSVMMTSRPPTNGSCPI
jgi:hypothetical protein